MLNRVTAAVALIAFATVQAFACCPPRWHAGLDAAAIGAPIAHDRDPQGGAPPPPDGAASHKAASGAHSDGAGHCGSAAQGAAAQADAPGLAIEIPATGLASNKPAPDGCPQCQTVTVDQAGVSAPQGLLLPPPHGEHDPLPALGLPAVPSAAPQRSLTRRARPPPKQPPHRRTLTPVLLGQFLRL